METINASEEGYEWVKDPKGYFLIRIRAELIEVGFCENKHPREIKYAITGSNAREICLEIFKRELISRIDHALCIGRELQKAEVALKLGLNYVQDEDLEYK